MRDPLHATESSATRRTWAPIAIGIGLVTVVVATTFSPISGLEHTIRPGEVLSTIAEEHAVSVDALVAANEIADPNLIVSGHSLTIPDAVSTSSNSSAASTSRATGQTGTHAVVPGDSVWAIANRLGVSATALATLNELGDDALIFPGQLLTIPAGEDIEQSTPTPASTHTVAAGDTVSEIAEQWNVTSAALVAANDIESTYIIRVGQVLEIPALTIALEGLPLDLREDPARLALAPTFDRWANEYDVPADLMKALAWFESGWNNEKLSSANAIGIGQILPITADFVSEVLLGETLDPYVEEDNIRLSARYMRYLLDNAGSVELAVASYYQGLSATREHGIYESSEFYVDGIVSLRERFD